MKPEALTQIKKGTAIGAPVNMGFTETFNWLVRFCRNLKGDGHWLSVDNPDGDNPTITIGDDLLDEIGQSGGGECDCEMEATCPHYDKDAEGSSQQYWPNAEVGKFTDCQGNETTLYAPNHIQVKGNAYPYWTNLTDKIELVSASNSNVRVSADDNKLTIGCYYI